MLDRVAKAMAEDDCADWSRLSCRNYWRNLARTAFRAMREPTEAQLNTYCDPRNEAMKVAVAAEWRGMVAAVLTATKTEQPPA